MHLTPASVLRLAQRDISIKSALPISFPAGMQRTMLENVSLMQSSSLFISLSKAECFEIASFAAVRTFVRGEPLFSQGQPMRSLFLLQSGTVKETQVSLEGNEALLRISGKGEAVSLDSESLSRTHTCTARATEKSRALVWDYRLVQGFFQKFPQIERNIGAILATRLIDLQDRFLDLATETVSVRVLRSLSRLAGRIGVATGEGIRVSISQEELAGMIGATVFTVSRLLSRWTTHDFIVTRRESIFITDLRRLNAEIESQTSSRCRS